MSAALDKNKAKVSLATTREKRTPVVICEDSFLFLHWQLSRWRFDALMSNVRGHMKVYVVSWRDLQFVTYHPASFYQTRAFIIEGKLQTVRWLSIASRHLANRIESSLEIPAKDRPGGAIYPWATSWELMKSKLEVASTEES